MNVRETIRFYLIDCKTLPGKLIDVSILILNLLLCTTFVIETYTVNQEVLDILWKIEVIVVCIFIIEYFARLYAAKKRIKTIFSIYSAIDLMSILPTLALIFIPGLTNNFGFIRIIRIFKVFRVFRFLRFTADPFFFFGNITSSFLRVVRLILTILIIFFVSSGFFWFTEGNINEEVRTFGDAFYYTVVTLTTVGFGDITPATGGGRLVTVLMIISGIILIPWEASQIVREWINISEHKKIVCSRCGLMYHDKDASHCKYCGNIIFQEYEGV